MSRKKSAVQLEAARCTARSKATGTQCRRWAVSGYRVCVVHGAGAPARRRTLPPDGRLRQDPRTAPLVHGLYSSRLHRELGDVVAEFYADKAALFDLETMTARLWALLLRCDEVDGALTGVDLDDPDSVRSVLATIEATRRVLRELMKAAVLHHRLTHRPSGLSEQDVVGMFATVLLWTREIAEDESVPRSQIADALVRRVERTGRGEVDALPAYLLPDGGASSAGGRRGRPRLAGVGSAG